MRRLIALGLILLAGCEPRASEPKPTQPLERVEAPAKPEPDAVEPGVEPPVEAAAELPSVAGVHYLELVTAGADPHAELPMIVAIHGLGDSPEGFAGLLADFDRPARVILPRALDPYQPGWSWFPIRARDNDIEGLAAGIERAANTLAPAIAELTKQRPTVGKPIVTGFSQGGMLAFCLAVHHGQLFSAALPIGGWLPPPLWPKSPADTDAPPIIAFHGDDDRAVRYQPTQQAVAHLQTSGYRVELETYAGIGHAIPPDMRDDLLAAIREALARIESH
ncbi:MAG TPA: alpha/beta fold hydrolase [Enhygromyxa sp.]|nr:alpha/beta fold hydrolase [Enhygromyxa sp.]